MDLRKLLCKKIANGLSRQALASCSEWACKYRLLSTPTDALPQKWNFRYAPWTVEMHDCKDDMIVGQKCAQMGYTETAINRAFHTIDILGESVLYVMPTASVAYKFSTSRFDPILSDSKHLSNLFSDVKNKGQKQAGKYCFYIVGSNSRADLKSISTAKIFFDELDEMSAESVRLAEERASGQKNKFFMYISTPTIPGKGINVKFIDSSQDHFFFACPHCGKMIELTLEDNLIITAEAYNDPLIKKSHLVCHLCKGVLDHEAKADFLANGQWVTQFHDRIGRGFYINQLYSTAMEPWRIAADYLASLSDPTIEQELYNSKLGLPHVVKGAQIDDEMLENCIGSHSTRSERYKANSIVCMGVDVGANLNYEITEYIIDNKGLGDLSSNSFGRVLKANICKNFHELDELMAQFRVDCCVIDNQPETRSALELANRWPGRVHLCVYNSSVAGREINASSKEHRVLVNRTTWLDAALGRFKTGKISLPFDICPEYKKQIKAPIRVYKNDANGNSFGVYEHSESTPDHYAHARNYCEIALNICSVGVNRNIITGG